MAVRLALVAGLLAIAAALAATLAHAPLVPVGTNSQVTHTELVTTNGPAQACQGGEVVPRGTAAVRLGLTGVLGPRVTVELYAGRRLLARGTRSASASAEGASVTLPLRPVPQRTLSAVRVCAQLQSVNGPVTMLGIKTTHARAAVGGDGRPLPGRMHVEYLQPSPRSWWDMAGATMRHLGLGRAAPGLWNAVLVLALGALLLALCSWLVVRELA